MKLPDVMRAVVLTGHGGLDKLVYHEEWPTPKPGPADVVVKVGACGLNNTDINTRTAWYSKSVTAGITDHGGTHGFQEANEATGNWSNTAITFPRIQGADVTGFIAAAGDNVDPERIGERVIIDPWLHSHGEWFTPEGTGYFGSECDGGFAEYTCIRAENAIKVRSDLSDAELATFPTVLTTAEHLVWRASPLPGEWVVISSASGGVGSTAIQLCRVRGARVIAIAGPTVNFDLRQLIYKDLQMTGATITPPGMFSRAVNLIESGALKPVLAKTFPLQKLAEAQKAFMAKSHVGNLVVTME